MFRKNGGKFKVYMRTGTANPPARADLRRWAETLSSSAVVFSLSHAGDDSSMQGFSIRHPIASDFLVPRRSHSIPLEVLRLHFGSWLSSAESSMKRCFLRAGCD
jgi:hypothetical protein